MSPPRYLPCHHEPWAGAVRLTFLESKVEGRSPIVGIRVTN